MGGGHRPCQADCAYDNTPRPNRPCAASDPSLGYRQSFPCGALVFHGRFPWVPTILEDREFPSAASLLVGGHRLGGGELAHRGARHQHLQQPRGRDDRWDFLYRATEPLLRPIRRILPIIGGFDLSPLVLLLAVWLVQMELTQLEYYLFRI